MKILDFRSYRRVLLDNDLERAKKYMKGKVLDLGGGRKRGEFEEAENTNWIVFDVKNDFGPTVLGDAHYLPFEENVFDCVKCTEVLEHVENPEKVIEVFWSLNSFNAFQLSYTRRSL